MLNAKGQMTFEAVTIIVVVVAALVVMQGIFKASIMGNWLSSAKQLGEPYNPPGTTGTILHTMESKTVTNVVSIVTDEDLYSLRIDKGKEKTTEGGTLTVKP